jgi:hypothetical protein
MLKQWKIQIHPDFTKSLIDCSSSGIIPDELVRFGSEDRWRASKTIFQQFL